MMNEIQDDLSLSPPVHITTGTMQTPTRLNRSRDGLLLMVSQLSARTFSMKSSTFTWISSRTVR
jgi:hypothetical protein